MRINIYYGGRGLPGDPTVFVINKLQQVLEELRVEVVRYNLYEQKNEITTLPGTLKEADGIILASTVEWHGIGGYMHQFLDACWLYGDKEKISSIYMSPVVMSTTYGEREGKLELSVAWEILGGRPCSGLCGYIADADSLDGNTDYAGIIEKKAENMYRTINQHIASFPASNQVINKTVLVTKDMNLTPQESEQLSKYASDEGYVQQQKEDISELTTMFRDLMESSHAGQTDEYLDDFREHFHPQAGCRAVYRFIIKQKDSPLIVDIKNRELNCYYGDVAKADVDLTLSTDTMNEIVASRMTFQRAFMGGSMKTKGDFKLLRELDQLFVF